jgi:uncharacterized membrane protein
MNAIADTLSTLSVLRVEVTDGDKSQEDALKKLAADTAAEFTRLTSRLVALYDLSGSAVAKVEEFAGQTTVTQSPVGAKKAGVIGGLISGAAGGAAADLAAGGLTLGAGAVIGAVLGAIGGFGGTRALNRARGKTRSWVYWTEQSMVMWAQTAIFRYLAVMHFGRGRGDWVLGDTPAHWRQQVSQAIERRRGDMNALLSARAMDLDAAPEAMATGAFSKVMRETSLEVLECLYGQIRGVPDPNRSASKER